MCRVFRFANAVLDIVLKRPHSEDKARFGHSIEARATRLYRGFYRRFTTFEAKDIFELGAGPYSVKVYLGFGVKSYTLANLSFGPAFDAISDTRIRRVITTDSLVPIHNGSVDVVISENAFEHLQDYEAMIEELRRILRPGGILMARFSPLYYSPYGAHFHDVTMIPWVHLALSEPRLRELIERESGTRENFVYQWEQFRTLNRLQAREFLRPFGRVGWVLEHASSFPFPGSYRWPQPLSKFLTHGLKVAARKV